MAPDMMERRNSFTKTHWPPRFPGRVVKEHGHDLFKDKVYLPEHWEAHQSWKRHTPSVSVTLRVVLWYWPPLLFVSLVGVFVCLYNRFAQPAGAPDITSGNYQSPFLLSSFALALLLVFRTNSSYDRWWEARKLWGGLVGVTRNLVFETRAYGAKDTEELKDMFARWVIMLPFTLRAHLTAERDFSTGAEGVLDDEEHEWLGKQPCLPIAVVQVLTEILPRLNLPIYLMAQVFEGILTYSATLAACERIYRQPIPVAYTRHTSRFLIVWISTFPFALFRDFTWFTPVVGTIVGFLLIGVENIGIQIEQPFAVLPLHGMCSYMRDNVQAMRTSGPEAHAWLTELLASNAAAAVAKGNATAMERQQKENTKVDGPTPGPRVSDVQRKSAFFASTPLGAGTGPLWQGDGGGTMGTAGIGLHSAGGDSSGRRSRGDLDYEVPSERGHEGGGGGGLLHRLSNAGSRARPSRQSQAETRHIEV